MHEMALCEGIIGIVEDEARRRAFSRVKTIVLDIGCLSHVSPEALVFCFDAVAAGTRAAGAALEIRDVPGAAWCPACSTTVPVVSRIEACPHCGGYRLQVTAGEEMRVSELEVV